MKTTIALLAIALLLPLSAFAEDDPAPHYEAGVKAEAKRDSFVTWCREQGYQTAAETLVRDWDRMVAFYAYPEAHWSHIRTTNPVESPFAALRLRTDAAKRYKRVDRATALIWKLLMVAETRFRRLKGRELLPGLYRKRFHPQNTEEQQILEEVAA